VRRFGSFRRSFCVLTCAIVFGALAAPAHAAFTGTLAGTTATFTGSAGFDFLQISNEGVGLRHNQPTGPGTFESAGDFDSATAGEQPLADTAAAQVIVNAGGDVDSVQLGSAGTVFQAAFTVNGEGGTDFLTVPEGTAGADTVTLNGATITGVASGPVNYATTEQVIVRTAGGNDLIKVDATTATQTIVFGGGGDDTLQLANGAGLASAGRFRGEAGTDTLDYSAWTTPVSVDLGKTAMFKATLTGANQVPPVMTAATGAGQVEFTDTTTSTFDYELGVNNGLTSADITDSHIHAGAAGVNGGVIFPIGAGNTWTDPGDPFTHAENQTDPDITEPLLRDGNTYFNIHTTAHSDGEIRGQLTLDPMNGYGGPATGAQNVNTVETVIGGAGPDVLKGNVLANFFDGRGGADTLDCGEGSDSETSDLTDTVTGCETMVGGSATVTGVDPASPADNRNPKVKGTVSPTGLNVRIFANPTCSGTPLATGSGADFAGAGIPVTVADGSLTTFYAAAADTANQSACSTTSASYQETGTSQPPPGGENPPAGTVSTINPKASGGGARITLDTGATADCPATATAACTLTATATAKLPNRPGKKAKIATLGKLTQTVAQGQTAGVVFKLSRKASKSWRKAGKLKFNFAIELTVPGGDSQTQTGTKKLKPPKRK
jgi:hypothetical protein